MGIVSFIVRKTRSLARIMGSSGFAPAAEKSQREVCEMLEAYYNNNDLYANIQNALREIGQWSPSIKAMRNPASAVAEFYASTVWPGALPAALPVVAENPAVSEAVAEIWRRSNWDRFKQLVVRQAAITGDAFMRAATTDSGKPFIQVALTKNVSDWREDNAGNIVWLRYEVVRKASEDLEFTAGRGDNRDFTHVEIWDAETVKTYKHYFGLNASVESMGAPVVVEHGLGFAPWVRACFRDVGEPFGYPPIWTVLDKIDEVNQKATRLAQILFRYNQGFWALKSNSVDAQGRPLPPPTIKQDGAARGDSEAVAFRDNEIVRLPGMAELQCLVPPIDFKAHADAVLADLDEIKRDLPELRFYDLMEVSNVSGVALSYMLAPAVARVIEVRGNLERALVKVNMMCITIGQRAGLYRSAGTYENGATNHAFAERDVIALTLSERVDIAVKRVGMGVPIAVALKREGDWTDADIAALENAQLNATVAAAGRTAGPTADILTQSATRTAAKQDAAPNMDRAIADAVGGAVERALDAKNALLAEYLGGAGAGGTGAGTGGRK
jgi:hypothetical protein